MSSADSPRSDSTRRFPPSLGTFPGRAALRVAAALDTRDALVARFASECPPGVDVATVVDEVIADHNAHVSVATRDTIRLLDAIDGFPTRGLAISFGDGADDAAALNAVVSRAAPAMERGASIDGYVYATDAAVSDLILNGRVTLTYGVFAETGAAAADVGDRVLEVLHLAALPIEEHDESAQRVVLHPLDFAMPYHGHELHEIAGPEPD